jgi:AcrR family transcriptional regulator
VDDTDRGEAGALYRGQSALERSQARRRRLVDGALALIGEGGWAALSVRGACAEAKLTARYFYESFAGRDALAIAVFDEVAEGAIGQVLAAFAAAPDTALDKARAAIGAIVELVGAQPRTALVLYGPADGLPSVGERRTELTRRFAGLVEERGRDFYGLAPDPHLSTAATLLAGGLSATLLDWATGVLIVERAQLVEDCALMFVAAGEAAVMRARDRQNAE